MASSSRSSSTSTRPLRIAFIHPDLGIGGAERLIVDAAVGLQDRGHWVEIFTSYHEDGPGGRSFEETRNGTLKVHVLGAWLFPPSMRGRFTIICAILRQFHLTFSFLLASLLYYLAFIPFLALPLHRSFNSSTDWSSRRQLPPFDVVIIDQLSTSIPALRWLGANRVVFYCHFPDLLLSPSRSANEHIATTLESSGAPSMTLKMLLRKIYRAPIDRIEELTTGQADKILVNSEFTKDVFRKTFKGMRRIPRVVYPGIDVAAYGLPMNVADVKENDRWLLSDAPTLLSINRFEEKKNVGLAVEAFAQVKTAHPSPLKLVLAGGYDPRLPDNVQTLLRLQKLASSLNLTHYTYAPSRLASPPSDSQSSYPDISSSPPSKTFDVLFLVNMTNDQKSLLLSSPSVVALLYTPSFEHLGIVPLEAMASGLPVLATDSGGPTETIVDTGLGPDTTSTGLLRAPSAEVWAKALNELLTLSTERRKAVGESGKRRVRELFSVGKLAQEMELACRDAIAIAEPIHAEVAFLKVVGFVCMGWMMFVIAVFAFVVGLPQL